MPPPFLLKRRGLASPTGLIGAGFDPDHIAARGCVFSAISSGASAFNLLSPNIKPTTATAPTRTIDSHLGVTGRFVGTQNNGYNFAGALPLTTDTIFTAAFIARPSTVAGAPTYWQSSNFSAGWWLITQGGFWTLATVINSGMVSSISAVANVPYFIVTSAQRTATNTYNVNFLSLRLDTGKVETSVLIGASTTDPTVNDGTFSLGGSPLGVNDSTARMACGMYANTRALSIPEMLVWARDPWSFWYPTPAGAVAFDPGYDVSGPSGPAPAGPGRTPPLIFRPRQGPSKGLWTPRSTFIPATGTTVSGDGASAGVGTATGVGSGLANSAAASAGTGTATGVGAALFNAVAASAGLGTATATGQGIDNGVGAAAGTGTASGVGASTLAGDGVAASAGVATVTGVSAATAASVGASSGTGAATGIGAALDAAVASSTGTGTATAIGTALAASVAASTGIGTALGVGDSQQAGQAVGAATGTGTATGIGASLFAAIGNAAGTAIVVGASPVTELPAGGAGHVMQGHRFTRKRWKELLELIAAEEAAAAKAQKVGSPARADALAEASGKAADAISALEGVEGREAYEADMGRLQARLEAATAAKKVGDSIREARAAAVLAAKLQAEADEENEINMLLDDPQDVVAMRDRFSDDLERIAAMIAAMTRKI